MILHLFKAKFKDTINAIASYSVIHKPFNILYKNKRKMTYYDTCLFYLIDIDTQFFSKSLFLFVQHCFFFMHQYSDKNVWLNNASFLATKKSSRSVDLFIIGKDNYEPFHLYLSFDLLNWDWKRVVASRYFLDCLIDKVYYKYS